MTRPLSAWMTMENREYCRVRRRQHRLEWLQLWKQSAVAEKDVLFVVHISSDKGKDVEDAEVLSRYPILQ